MNFSDFYPPSVAELQWDGWRIRLSAVEHSTDVFKSLKETGGYAFTHWAAWTGLMAHTP